MKSRARKQDRARDENVQFKDSSLLQKWIMRRIKYFSTIGPSCCVDRYKLEGEDATFFASSKAKNTPLRGRLQDIIGSSVRKLEWYLF